MKVSQLGHAGHGLVRNPGSRWPATPKPWFAAAYHFRFWLYIMSVASEWFLRVTVNDCKESCPPNIVTPHLSPHCRSRYGVCHNLYLRGATYTRQAAHDHSLNVSTYFNAWEAIRRKPDVPLPNVFRKIANTENTETQTAMHSRDHSLCGLFPVRDPNSPNCPHNSDVWMVTGFADYTLSRCRYWLSSRLSLGLLQRVYFPRNSVSDGVLKEMTSALAKRISIYIRRS